MGTEWVLPSGVADPVVSSVTAIALALVGSLFEHRLARRGASVDLRDGAPARRRLSSHVDRLGTFVVPVVLALAGGAAVAWTRPGPRAAALDRGRARPTLVAVVPVLVALGVVAVCVLVASVEAAGLRPGQAVTSGRGVPVVLQGVVDVGATALLIAVFWLVPLPWLPGGDLLAVVASRRRPAWRRLRRRSGTLVLLPVAVLVTAPPVVAAVVGLQTQVIEIWSTVGP